MVPGVTAEIKSAKEPMKIASKIGYPVMVKAAAYGSGSTEIARILEFNQVAYLAVAYADEGIELRKAGIQTPIMVLNPTPSVFASMLSYRLEPEIYSLEQ